MGMESLVRIKEGVVVWNVNEASLSVLSVNISYIQFHIHVQNMTIVQIT